MNEEEIMNALVKGAILKFSDSGAAEIMALDDLSPKGRECFRASKEHDRAHQKQCPNCLESEAENTLMDAAAHREEGNEAIALELEAEAEQLRLRAARRRAVEDDYYVRNEQGAYLHLLIASRAGMLDEDDVYDRPERIEFLNGDRLDCRRENLRLAGS